MVTIERVKNGVLRYIDNDLMPHLDGIKKIGLGIYANLASDNAVKMAMQYKDHPAIAVLEVMDESGNVDIDKLYHSVIPMFSSGEKLPIKVPVIGEFKIDRSDIESLYSYIRG